MEENSFFQLKLTKIWSINLFCWLPHYSFVSNALYFTSSTIAQSLIGWSCCQLQCGPCTIHQSDWRKVRLTRRVKQQGWARHHQDGFNLCCYGDINVVISVYMKRFYNADTNLNVGTEYKHIISLPALYVHMWRIWQFCCTSPWIELNFLCKGSIHIAHYSICSLWNTT